MATYTQKQSLSWGTTMITICIILLFVAISLWGKSWEEGMGWGLAITLAVTLLGMVISSLCFMPMKVSVDDKDLTLWFSFRYKKIPLDRIAEVTPYQLPKNTIRLCGSGGFMGYWGWFRDAHLGRYMMYATQQKNLLAIKLTDGKCYVISCQDPTALEEIITGHK
ncbi:MAG: PH domain-containing protein [Bacteroidales bacterium]|nr:PH domain-containing protein [Bacteroidales bacterium]